MIEGTQAIAAVEASKQHVEVTATTIADVIRQQSAVFRLATTAYLREQFPTADISGLLQSASSELTDIERIAGTSAIYYYSSLCMTTSYATHLARVENNDPMLLVAQTVRDESRDYTRPTALASFFEPPFQLSQSDMASLLTCFGQNPGFEDIRACTASNGDIYLYSTIYLTDVHAQGLIEFYAVEIWQNP